MTLQYKFFSIPVTHEQDAEEELNSFLRRVRLINIYREMVCKDGRHYWAITAEYYNGPQKLDNVLSSTFHGNGGRKAYGRCQKAAHRGL